MIPRNTSCWIALVLIIMMASIRGSAFRLTRSSTVTRSTVSMMSSSSSSSRSPPPATTNTTRRTLMGRLGVGLASLLAFTPSLKASNTIVHAAEPTYIPKSSMGIDLTPMSLNDALKEADRLKLTQNERHILFDAGTEMPGTGRTANGYKHNHKGDGVWVSAVSGVPLFDASAKYDSGTGWPSFFKPIDPAHVIERLDPRDGNKPGFLQRIEVLDRKSNTHLGHVFSDGPKPTGLRYCMNTASMRFIPRDEYEAWLKSLPKDKGTAAGAKKTEL